MSFAERLKQKKLEKDNTSQNSAGDDNFNVTAEAEITSSESLIEAISESAAEVTNRRTTENNRDESSLILMVAQVFPDPDQPRKSVEQIEEKKVSLREYGQFDPITVRFHPEKDNCYMIVNGERRWTALNELRLEDPVKFSTIRATLRDDEKIHDEAERLTIQIVSNLHRDNMKPYEAYKSLKKLKQLKGFTKQSELVEHVGMSKGQISKLLRFDDLTEEEINLVETGQLSAATIRSSGIEVAKEKAKPENTKKSGDESGKMKRVPKVSISMEAATNLALMLQTIADKNGLSSIELGDQTKKELIAILEARSAEVVGSL